MKINSIKVSKDLNNSKTIIVSDLVLNYSVNKLHVANKVSALPDVLFSGRKVSHAERKDSGKVMIVDSIESISVTLVNKVPDDSLEKVSNYVWTLLKEVSESLKLDIVRVNRTIYLTSPSAGTLMSHIAVDFDFTSIPGLDIDSICKCMEEVPGFNVTSNVLLATGNVNVLKSKPISVTYITETDLKKRIGVSLGTDCVTSEIAKAMKSIRDYVSSSTVTVTFSEVANLDLIQIRVIDSDYTYLFEFYMESTFQMLSQSCLRHLNGMIEGKEITVNQLQTVDSFTPDPVLPSKFDPDTSYICKYLETCVPSGLYQVCYIKDSDIDTRYIGIYIGIRLFEIKIALPKEAIELELVDNALVCNSDSGTAIIITSELPHCPQSAIVPSRLLLKLVNDKKLLNFVNVVTPFDAIEHVLWVEGLTVVITNVNGIYCKVAYISETIIDDVPAFLNQVTQKLDTYALSEFIRRGKVQ